MRAMRRMSRREFARVTGAIAGAALLPTGARGDEKPKADKAAEAKPAKLLPASQAEADARVQMIVARWGARLSAAERKELARMSAEAQQQLDELRAFALDWGDEPAHVFRAPRRRR